VNGNLTYEVARQQMAERQRTAREAGEARARRAAARRGRQSRAGAPDAAGLPAIPDFAHEMFKAARDVVPAPDAPGRQARPGR
jgi:hypothetical protein